LPWEIDSGYGGIWVIDAKFGEQTAGFAIECLEICLGPVDNSEGISQQWYCPGIYCSEFIVGVEFRFEYFCDSKHVTVLEGFFMSCFNLE